jgi:hypothetical protein
MVEEKKMEKVAERVGVLMERGQGEEWGLARKASGICDPFVGRGALEKRGDSLMVVGAGV